MPAIQVMLPPEYENELRTQLTAIISEAVEGVKKQAKINDSPWLPSKKDCYGWLKVSPQKFDELLEEGLPFHVVRGMTMFYKSEVNQFILAK